MLGKFMLRFDAQLADENVGGRDSWRAADCFRFGSRGQSTGLSHGSPSPKRIFIEERLPGIGSNSSLRFFPALHCDPGNDFGLFPTITLLDPFSLRIRDEAG